MPLWDPLKASLIIPGEATVATLPNASLYARQYIWVTDLHDGQPDYVISDGSSWKPVRPLATHIVANANADMTLQALKNSPTEVLKGVLSANRTVTISTVGAYSGARFRIKREATGLFGIVISAAGSPSIAANSWMDLEFSAGNGWIQTASGGLL